MQVEIDRTTPFDPELFFGEEWKIEKEDDRSLRLNEIDISRIVLNPIIENVIISIKQEKYIHLDAAIFMVFWKDQNLFLELIKGFDEDIFLLFDGTIISGPGGNLFVMCLYRLNEAIKFGYYWLDSDHAMRNLFSARLDL